MEMLLEREIGTRAAIPATTKAKKSSKKTLTWGKDPIQLGTVNEPTMHKTNQGTGLVLYGVRISLQNFGTRLLLFMQGKKEDIEQRYYSFYNHEATSGELEWWSDNCAFIWLWDTATETATQKLEKAMAFAAHFELQRTHDPKRDSLGRALKIARERIARIEWVTWMEWTSFLNIYDFADSIGAEKGTGNFDDDVVAKGLERTGVNLDARKLQKELNDEETGDIPYTRLPEKSSNLFKKTV